MTSRLKPEHRDRLESLRRAYARDLPARVRAIGEAAASLEQANRGQLEALHQLVHRLTGSAAIYGFTGVSRAASSLEALVSSALAGAAALPPQGGPALADLLRALESALTAATESSSEEKGGT